MKKILLLVIFTLYFIGFKAQSAADAAVQVTAAAQTSPPQITLDWIGNGTSTQYQVFRKLKTSPTWGPPLATLAGTINQYIDNSVSTGISYEYRITRTGSNYNGFGYINS